MQTKVIKSQWPVEEGALIVAGRRFFQLFIMLALRNLYQSFSFGFKVVIFLIFLYIRPDVGGLTPQILP